MPHFFIQYLPTKGFHTAHQIFIVWNFLFVYPTLVSVSCFPELPFKFHSNLYQFLFLRQGCDYVLGNSSTTRARFVSFSTIKSIKKDKINDDQIWHGRLKVNLNYYFSFVKQPAITSGIYVIYVVFLYTITGIHTQARTRAHTTASARRRHIPNT